jgi:hypothetical protein
MRTFAVMYKPPFTHPRCKKFQARSFKDALTKAGKNIDKDFDPTKTPLMLVDFLEERAEMVADQGNGRLRILEDENYGEMTDFTRRVL